MIYLVYKRMSLGYLWYILSFYKNCFTFSYFYNGLNISLRIFSLWEYILTKKVVPGQRYTQRWPHSHLATSDTTSTDTGGGGVESGESGGLAGVGVVGGDTATSAVLNDNHSHIESGYEEVSFSKHLESVVSEKDTEINELTGENRLLQEDLEVCVCVCVWVCVCMCVVCVWVCVCVRVVTFSWNCENYAKTVATVEIGVSV